MSLYVKLVSNWYRDPRMVKAGREARELYLAALGLAKEEDNDGYIAPEQLRFLDVEGDGQKAMHARAARLVELELWIMDGDGWRISAWLKHNLPHDKELSQKRAEAGRAGAAARWDGKLPSKQNGTCQNNEMANTTTTLLCSATTTAVAIPPADAPARDAAPPAAVPDAPVLPEMMGEPVDWPADDPAYQALDQAGSERAATELLALWERKVGKVGGQGVMAHHALVTLHLKCRRSWTELRGWVEFIATDDDAKGWWGTGRSPATWLRRTDGIEPTWCKIRAHWLKSIGGKYPAARKVLQLNIPPGPAPAVDPACDCRRGFITVDGHREGCPKCTRGQHIRAGGRL